MKSVSELLNVSSTICLYGNATIGYGFIADVKTGKAVGDGAIKSGSCLTSTIVDAIYALRRECGADEEGTLAIFLPGGEKVATIAFNRFRYAGDLSFGPAPKFSISI